MYRLETSVLTSAGARLHFTQREHESKDGYRGRLLCEIETRIAGRGPTPKGTRWVQWDHQPGHPLYQFRPDGTGRLVESTGAPYRDRVVTLPGIFDLDAARRALGLV